MGFTNKNNHAHQVDYEGDMFTGITTYHGLVRIYNSKQWFGRIFWITVVIIAYSVFVVQGYNLLYAYRQRPTNYKSNIRTPTDGISFPAVTICNISPVKQSLVDQYHMPPKVLTYIMSSFLAVENMVSFSGFAAKLNDYDAEFRNWTAQIYSKSPLRRGHRRKMTLGAPSSSSLNGFNEEPSEEFKFEQFFNDTGCCQYAIPMMTDVGLCYHFNHFGDQRYMKRQYVSGESYGLQMVIDVKTDEYPKSTLPAMDKGIRFYTNRIDEAPDMSAHGIAIPPGFKGSGAIIATKWNLLERKDWGVCQRDWHPDDDPIHYMNYTLANCEANCMANFYKKNCNCVPMKYHIHAPNIDVCTPKEQSDCFRSVTNQTFGNPHSTSTKPTKTNQNSSVIHHTPSRLNKTHSSGEGEEMAVPYWYKCSGDTCGVECNKEQYDIYMSYANIEPDLLSTLNLDIKNKTYARTNYVVLTTFMRDIAYTEHIQQRALDATTILSNIGGNTGMFLGMSVITLAEIFVFFTKLCWSYCPCISGRRRKHVHAKMWEEELHNNDNNASNGSNNNGRLKRTQSISSIQQQHQSSSRQQQSQSTSSIHHENELRSSEQFKSTTTNESYFHYNYP